MNDEKFPPFPKRLIYCEQCGNDKPWARTDWVPAHGVNFCSWYCKQNYDAFLLRMWRKGKKVKPS